MRSDRHPSQPDRAPSARRRGFRPRWGAAVISCVAVAAALIFVAWAKMQTVQITYRIDELIDTEEELANDQRRLRTQLAELRSPRNLEALAPDLGLVPPEPGQVVVVTGDPEGLTAILEGSDEEPTDETDASAPAPDADAEEGTP